MVSCSYTCTVVRALPACSQYVSDQRPAGHVASWQVSLCAIYNVKVFIFILYVVWISLFLLNRCNEVVEVYIQDTDPDSLLNIGADMRKIQMCYKILKVSSFSANDKTLCHANLRTAREHIFLYYHGHWPGG